jgi:hypothetical protein
MNASDNTRDGLRHYDFVQKKAGERKQSLLRLSRKILNRAVGITSEQRLPCHDLLNLSPQLPIRYRARVIPRHFS